MEIRTEEDSFYVLGEKKSVVFVFFVGKISGCQINILKELAFELKNKPHKIAVLVFRDVPMITADVFIELAHLQKSIRESGKLLGLCSILPKIKSDLLFPHIIRATEVYNNLHDAWRSMREKLGPSSHDSKTPKGKVENQSKGLSSKTK